jgi:hypothetical protein
MDLNEKFFWQLEQGNHGERVVMNFLKERMNCELISYNNDKKFDLKIKKNNKEYLIEIKTDCYDYYKGIMGSGNIFVETAYKGNPSGVKASKSDIYIFYFPYYEKLLIVSKTILLNNLYKGHFTYGGGDGGKSNGVLLNIFTQDFMREYHIPLNKFLINKI